MTIEFSLRRRATHARCFAILWLSLAMIVLIGSYISLPVVAGETLNALNQLELSADNASAGSDTAATGKLLFIHLHIFALIILILCLAVVAFASYLLARTAFIELDSAARFIGLADALCIAGNDFNQLEKAATLLVPQPKYFPELSAKNLKAFLELVKTVRG